MSRQIVLDTETTGLEPSEGHRIIEIGCVELVNRRPTGDRYHQYIRPDRDIESGAIEVHGITNDFLANKPTFPEIVDEFISFIKGAELVIHNAPFDVGFIDYELGLLGGTYGKLNDHCTVLDTLERARQLHPGQRNNLDALCKRYQIDNSQRELHGALLDAEILADVYLAMTGGQASLSLEGFRDVLGSGDDAQRPLSADRPRAKIIRASSAEMDAHHQYLEAIQRESGGCVWLKAQ